MSILAFVGIADEVCVTGGVAKNPAVVKALEKVTERKVNALAVDPQIVGALGAAIFARERYANLISVEGVANA